MMATLASTTIMAGLAVTAVTTVTTAERIVVIIAEMTARSIKDVVVAVATLEVAVVADVDVVAPPHGLTSHVKFVTKKDTMPKIAGPVMQMMMTMVTKRSMLLMGSIQIGTKIRVPHIISPVNIII
jgi:ACT domain-containing protein